MEERMPASNGTQVAMGRTLRVAQVGCGQISAQHLKAYRESALVDLAITVDVDPVAAREAAEANGGVPWTTSLDEALARDDVDFVSIATPHYLHAPMTIAAARAGKHVLCEKPFTVSLADADAMIDACRTHGVQLGMWMVMRYSATTRLAQALLQAEAIGRIVNIRLADVHNKVRDYYQRGVGGRARPTDWRPWRSKAGGGALIMNAIHQLDALRFMTGLEVTRVTGEWVSFTGLAEVEDMIDVLLRYSNGAIGTIDTANYAPGGGEPGALRIYGSKGQIQLARGGVVRVFVEEPFGGLQGEISAPALTAGEWHEVPAGDGANSRTLLLDDYARAVIAGRTPAITGHDGRAAIEIVLAAYRSAELGGSVTLPMAVEPKAAEAPAAREPALAGAR